jgi:hypothetical protein
MPHSKFHNLHSSQKLLCCFLGKFIQPQMKIDLHKVGNPVPTFFRAEKIYTNFIMNKFNFFSLLCLYENNLKCKMNSSKVSLPKDLHKINSRRFHFIFYIFIQIGLMGFFMLCSLSSQLHTFY